MFSLIRKKFNLSTFKKLPFKKLDLDDLNYFQTILSSQQIINDPSQLQSYNTCWRNLSKGQSKLVLRPNKTQQVSKILSYCNSKNLAITPQSGNTGLVGGSVPIFDQIILSMKNFNKIQHFDDVSSVLSCQAGCILEKLNQHLSGYGFEIPLDLGAKGSCLIGGNASTNAGGKYVVKHGPFRSYILGMEVVLPNGTILDMSSSIQKDNTGYDLKDLFIGSQGTLGIITKLNIKCVKVDENKNILVLKTDAYDKIIKSKSLNALEYVDGHSYQSVIRNLHPSIMDVNLTDHLLFIQLTLKHQDIQDFINSLPQFNDSILSNSDKEYTNIWKIREDVANAAKREGIVHSYDVSFDVKEWPNLLNLIRSKIDAVILGYGHIGDGNLHINICVKQDKDVMEQQIFQYIVSRKGSISAEHGIGSHKPHYLHMQKSKEIIDIYKKIKKIFDPKGIMNPYKVLL